MATGTIIFRPSSDNSLNHSCSRGSQGYILISDSSADDDSTYIYQTVSSMYGSSETSSFILTGTLPSEKINITAVRLYSRAKKSSSDLDATYHCYFGVGTNAGGSSSNSGTSATLSQNYSTINNDSQEMVTNINSYINSNNSFPTISVAITTEGNLSDLKANDGNIRVTQVYMEVDYETVEEENYIYIKENGNWSTYSKIYKKINNSWIEQTNLEEVFNSSTNYVKGEVQ